jgi:NTP pyrophosphatase (non-canonical NTP hydrolase)
MDEFVRSRGWYDPAGAKPQAPRNLAASIALEAGEVLECFQWTEHGEPEEVGAELADVVLYAAQLANVMGIDLGSAVRQKLELNESRWAALPEEQWQQLAS